MFGDRHYVPILKWRQGEQLALRELDPQVRGRLTPLIEIPPVTWDYENDCPAKTIDEHVNGVADSIRRNWGDRPAFIDLPWCLDDRVSDGRLAVEKVFDDLLAKDQPAVPVTGLARSTNYQSAIRRIVARDRLGVCIRIEPEDWEDPGTLNQEVSELCDELGVRRQQCDLLIDFKSVAGVSVGSIVLLATSLLGMLDGINEWRTLIWAGSAFPENLIGIPADAMTHIPRSEWQAWSNIARRNSVARVPTFGDYAISHPEPSDVDPRVMRMSANLRYTTSDSWLVLKGRNVRQHGHEQFNALCRALVGHPDYSGPGFSWGDSYIDRCARGVDGPGNASMWRRVGVSHHLTLVTHALANFS